MVATCVSEPTRGHLDRFGEHMPPASLVESLDAEALRRRAAAGELNALNPGVFLDEYVVNHKPVVFKGLARDWKLRKQVLDDEWLVDVIGEDASTRIETKEDDKHQVPPNVMFGEFVERYEAANMYMVDETPPPLHKHIPMPEPLRCKKMSSKFFVTYFWMSTGETDSKMHIDTDENMMCVLHGTKRVLLVDPEYSEDVYADLSYAIGVSPLDTRHVNHTEHPRAATVPYSLAVVDAGDCFFLPQNYWHYVHSFGKRNQAVTMWWKSKPLVAPERFNFTLSDLSFAQTLSNYEDYVQVVAPLTPSSRKECEAEAIEAGEARGLGSGPEAGRRFVQGMEELHMSDFEFATDKEEGDFGEDSKGDRDEGDWENPDQEALHLPEALAHCHFNLSNPRNPCFVAGCASRDDAFGCLRYTLEYCKRFADYGCQDLVWTLNKRSGEEYRIVTEQLPDVYTLDVEEWPAAARNNDEAGPPVPEELEEAQELRRDRARAAMRLQEADKGDFLEEAEEEDVQELSEWEDMDADEIDEEELQAVLGGSDGGAGLGLAVDSPLLRDDSRMPAGLTSQELNDYRALTRWLAERGLLLQGPPSRLARELHEELAHSAFAGAGATHHTEL